MMEDDLERERVVVASPKRKVSVFTSIGDFFNTLKAFIGTNYLALPFAFSNSGIILGIVGVFIIATLTDFCCQLLVKCKYIIIDRLVDEDTAQRPLSATELTALRQKLAKSISYGDVGRLAFGRWCEVLINLTVFFTQFLTCVCYFIFIGNACFTIFPMEPAMVPLNGSYPVPNASLEVNRFAPLANAVPMLSIENIPQRKASEMSPAHSRHRRAWDWEPLSPDNFAFIGYGGAEQAAMLWADGNTTTEAPLKNITTETPLKNATTPGTNTTTIDTNTTTAPPTPTTPAPTPHMYERSIAPSLIYLVMIPLPVFLMVSLIRNMRLLSPLTIIASIALFIGATAVLALLAIGFKVKEGYRWARFVSLPLFIGQLTSAYEGIGCVLPIESSMEGNRHLFPAFLHLSVYIVFLILTAFGLTGYLRYGDEVQQIILLNIEPHSWINVAVDVTLIVSVLCTYPLQGFPVIQLAESYLFGPESYWSKSSKRGLASEDDDTALINDDGHGIMERSTDSFVASHGEKVAVEVPDTVPSWIRNILRITITLAAMGCAIGLRHAYAYISAFAGAVGCSLLAFILPCAIHIQLKRREMNLAFLILDLVIIFVSVVCSILVVVIIIAKMVTNDTNF